MDPPIASPEKLAVNPEGKPVAAPIAVAPVVLCVIVGESATLIQLEVVVPGVTVFVGVIVIVPVALTEPHPPVNGIE